MEKNPKPGWLCCDADSLKRIPINGAVELAGSSFFFGKEVSAGFVNTGRIGNAMDGLAWLVHSMHACIFQFLYEYLLGKGGQGGKKHRGGKE